MKSQLLSPHGVQIRQVGLACLALVILSGCDRSPQIGTSSDGPFAPLVAQLPDVTDSNYRFEPGVMLEAVGTPIAVDSPGYACPTMADVDGDGVEDLVVGQFSGGKMHFYRNLAKQDERPKYASREWISTGSDPAQVPGVS